MKIKSYRLSISGMHCADCENVLEEALSSLPGVLGVKASFADESVVLQLDSDVIALPAVCAAMKATGYDYRNEAEKKTHGPVRLVARILLAVAGIVLLLQLNRYIDTELYPEAVVDGESYGLLFVVGLLTSLHCIGMCGGFVLSYATAETPAGRPPYLNHLIYGLGKTVSYGSMGAVFGAVGGAVGFTAGMRSLAMLLAGGFLMIYGLSQLDAFAGLRRLHIRMPAGFVHRLSKKRRHTNSPLVIGLLNGLMIACGPLQAMYIMAAGTGSPVRGAALLTVFALGTLPIMFVFGWLSTVITEGITRRFLKLSGLIIVLLGAMMFNRGMALGGTGYDAAALTAKAARQATSYMAGWQRRFIPQTSDLIVQQGYQVIYMEAEGFEYAPSTYHILKNIPVKWIINVKELSVCNKRIVIPALDKTIDLVLGLQLVEFVPKESGVINWSCHMGMMTGTLIVEE